LPIHGQFLIEVEEESHFQAFLYNKTFVLSSCFYGFFRIFEKAAIRNKSRGREAKSRAALHSSMILTKAGL
jgi:hypothetical protein